MTTTSRTLADIYYVGETRDQRQQLIDHAISVFTLRPGKQIRVLVRTANGLADVFGRVTVHTAITAAGDQIKLVSTNDDGQTVTEYDNGTVYFRDKDVLIVANKHYHRVMGPNA
jgi:hypothetical protein